RHSKVNAQGRLEKLLWNSFSRLIEEIPSELHEPPLGINFARSGMQKTDWLSLVASHSDSWLFGVAFYYGTQFVFSKSDRHFMC
ncbi:PHD finger protein alfin1-like, partial [Trifolium pratense]